jgi:hypothetical protein
LWSLFESACASPTATSDVRGTPLQTTTALHLFAGASISEANLICEYRQLAASDTDAFVQANFGSGQMTSLVSALAKAVPVVGSNVLMAGLGNNLVQVFAT